jgi:hypothetical protein
MFKEYFLKLVTDYYGKVKLSLKNYKEAEVTVAAMVRNQAWKRPSSQS